MKTYYKIFIAFFILIIGSFRLTAQDKDKSAFIWNVQFDYTSENSSKYFNAKASSQPRLYEATHIINDTLNPTVDSVYYTKYTVEFDRDVFGANASLIPGEDSHWSFNSRLQLSNYTLFEQYLFDKNTNRPTRTTPAKPSFFKADYFSLGAAYNFANRYEDKFQYGFTGELRTPFGFHRGLFDDPSRQFKVKDTTHNFLADGAFEALAGGFALIYVGKWDFLLNANYNWRDEEFKDQALFALRSRVSSVEGTHVTFQLEGAKALSKIQENTPFVEYQYQTAEDWLDLGLGFDLSIEKLNLGFIYTLRAFGRNTWGKNTIKFWARADI